MSSNRQSNSGKSRCGLVTAGVILVVAATSCSKESVIEDAAPLDNKDIRALVHDITPLRGEPGPLRLHRDGDEEQCSTCHDKLSWRQGAVALAGEHRDITFDHGLNVFCLNCHHPKNSDVYVHYDGSEIPGDEPNRVCAKCHGPHFRDYGLGVHGRVNGYWNADLGEQTMLACIQCHDPHRPKFPLIRPEPPPALTRFSIDSRGVTHR